MLSFDLDDPTNHQRILFMADFDQSMDLSKLPMKRISSIVKRKDATLLFIDFPIPHTNPLTVEYTLLNRHSYMGRIHNYEPLHTVETKNLINNYLNHNYEFAVIKYNCEFYQPLHWEKIPEITEKKPLKCDTLTFNCNNQLQGTICKLKEPISDPKQIGGYNYTFEKLTGPELDRVDYLLTPLKETNTEKSEELSLDKVLELLYDYNKGIKIEHEPKFLKSKYKEVTGKEYKWW